jgi:hypothetical protein
MKTSSGYDGDTLRGVQTAVAQPAERQVTTPCSLGSTKAITADVQFDVGHHQMVITSETEIA